MLAIKGSSVRDAIATYQDNLPDEFRKVIALLDSDTRAAILEAQANDWLPLETFVRYLEAHAEIVGKDPEVQAWRAEFVIERQLRGVYRIFTKLASPESLIARLSAVHETYFRGLRIERKLIEKGKAIVHYVGFRKEHRLMGPVIVGFYRKALKINGAKDVKAKFTTPIDEGRVYAELTVTWR